MNRAAIIALAFIALAGVDHATAADEYPDGITPNHVYAVMDQVERTVDVLVASQDRSSGPVPRCLETGVQPIHVYQMAIACTNRTIELNAGTRFVSVAPTTYFPKDVKRLGEQMLGNLQSWASSNGVTGLPQNRHEYTGKMPSDVFERCVSIFAKCGVLIGRPNVTANEVYSQMAAAAADATAILACTETQVDAEGPTPEPGRKPADVFKEALACRRQLNRVRVQLDLPPVPVPKLDGGYRIRPADVYVQGQIIRAELNIIKTTTNCSTEPARTSSVTGKTPADVWGQVGLVHHLTAQMSGLTVTCVTTN
jgi:hypothetical protein